MGFMRGWLDIMVRIAVVCLLLIAGFQASAACAAENPAPGHNMASAPMAENHDMHRTEHRPTAGHAAGGMICLKGCLSWIDEPNAAEEHSRFSVIAVHCPEEETQPASLRPETAERPPKLQV